MTPAARLAAAIAVLDRVLAGAPGEQALTNWGRASRYAGSGDRAAVRDLVFDALRCRRSFAALGGAETGRGLILGGLRAAGVDPAPAFGTGPHAPAPPTAAELADRGPLPELVALDCPDWLAPLLRASLGDDFAAVMALLRRRAPVFLRVNLRRADRGQAGRDAALAALAADGIAARPHPLADTALEVTGNARRIAGSAAYLSGLVELQDAASQAVVAALPLADGQRVLDFCAGGGGKALAMAARADLALTAHDADPRRMRDLPARAERAGIRLQITETARLVRGSFDLVLADVPCSGSGSWRRAPEAKWTLTAGRLAALMEIQAAILADAAALVAPRGTLAYATCSLLHDENAGQTDRFLADRPGWRQLTARRWTPLDGGDGFYLATMTRI
jgi:16S rRNA (cytosine967-C5)-methyltransferase